jgi:hypothetical protein
VFGCVVMIGIEIFVGYFGFTLVYVIVLSFLLRIILLCSVNRGVNDGFKVNTQTHLLPILATSIKVVLELHTFICYLLLCFVLIYCES